MRQNPFAQLLGDLLELAPTLKGVILYEERGDEIALAPESLRETLLELAAVNRGVAQRGERCYLLGSRGASYGHPIQLDGVSYLLLLLGEAQGEVELARVAEAAASSLEILLR